MKILITNNTLAVRAGTELYVRDIAIALLNRGHSPIVYSSILGAVAGELRAATIPVIDNLDELSVRPDLIHGHHHLETMTALLRFPDVPAIYLCHGWLPPEEMPPKFPRILRYIAVDQVCRDRLVVEHAIPEEQVRLFLNFVDLKRFKSRKVLPPRPKRALVFSNYVNEGNALPAIRAACDQSGIRVESLGLGNGNASSRPEDLLAEFDLVFAKGRSALEALAVGSAVVLCDAAGVGPMVTTENMETLRQLNFGIRALQNPMAAGALHREILRYNALDAGQVHSRIRQGAGMESALDKLCGLYEEVLIEHRQLPAPEPEVEMRAASTYLRHWIPNLTAQRQKGIQQEQLKSEYQNQRQLLTQADARYKQLESEHRQQTEIFSEIHQECSVLRERCGDLESERYKQSEKYRELQQEFENLRIIHQRLESEQQRHAAERQRLQSEISGMLNSSTVRLRNRLSGLPLVGAWLKSVARIAAGRGS